MQKSIFILICSLLMSTFIYAQDYRWIVWDGTIDENMHFMSNPNLIPSEYPDEFKQTFQAENFKRKRPFFTGLINYSKNPRKGRTLSPSNKAICWDAKENIAVEDDFCLALPIKSLGFQVKNEVASCLPQFNEANSYQLTNGHWKEQGYFCHKELSGQYRWSNGECYMTTKDNKNGLAIKEQSERILCKNNSTVNYKKIDHKCFRTYSNPGSDVIEDKDQVTDKICGFFSIYNTDQVDFNASRHMTTQAESCQVTPKEGTSNKVKGLFGKLITSSDLDSFTMPIEECFYHIDTRQYRLAKDPQNPNNTFCMAQTVQNSMRSQNLHRVPLINCLDDIDKVFPVKKLRFYKWKINLDRELICEEYVAEKINVHNDEWEEYYLGKVSTQYCAKDLPKNLNEDEVPRFCYNNQKLACCQRIGRTGSYHRYLSVANLLTADRQSITKDLDRLIPMNQCPYLSHITNTFIKSQCFQMAMYQKIDHHETYWKKILVKKLPKNLCMEPVSQLCQEDILQEAIAKLPIAQEEFMAKLDYERLPKVNRINNQLKKIKKDIEHLKSIIEQSQDKLNFDHLVLDKEGNVSGIEYLKNRRAKTYQPRNKNDRQSSYVKNKWVTKMKKDRFFKNSKNQELVRSIDQEWNKYDAIKSSYTQIQKQLVESKNKLEQILEEKEALEFDLEGLLLDVQEDKDLKFGSRAIWDDNLIREMHKNTVRR